MAHTLQHFVEGVEAVAVYLRAMGTELNPCKCARATTKGVPGLQLCLCPHLENPWHWVPAVDSVPYQGLQLQPDGEFSLQRKHGLRLVAGHHWCLNTLAPPKVVQDVILAILGGVTQYMLPLSPTTPTPRATWTTSRSRSQRQRAVRLQRLAGQGTRRRDPGAHAGANTVPAGNGGPRRHARPPPLASERAEATRMFWDIPGAHGTCPEVH